MFFMIVFAASFAHAAFEFSPIIAKLAPTGPEASTTFNVSNPGDTKIPVQITVVNREPDEGGKEVYTDTTGIEEQFRVFPAQLVMNPKETRAVRVSYIGSPKIKSELAFRIIAEELPVDVSDPKKVYKKAVANVNIAIKYVGSLYVTPTGAKSDLVLNAEPVDKAAAEPEAKGKDKRKPAAAPAKALVLVVTNKGTSHEVLRKPVLKLMSLVDNTELLLQGAELPMTNLNILAGKTRKFTFDWPTKLPVGPVKASFEPTKE